MARRIGFSRAQHERVGLELARMRDRLGNLWCCIQRAEGVSRGRKALAKARAVEKAIDALRGELSGIFWDGSRMDFGDPYNPSADLRAMRPEAEQLIQDKPLTYDEMDLEGINNLRGLGRHTDGVNLERLAVTPPGLAPKTGDGQSAEDR